MTGITRRSVTGRLRLFFESNPDEELSYDDIVAKFDCSLFTARDAVKRLRQTSVLESVHVVRLRSKGIASDKTSGGLEPSKPQALSA